LKEIWSKKSAVQAQAIDVANSFDAVYRTTRLSRKLAPKSYQNCGNPAKPSQGTLGQLIHYGFSGMRRIGTDYLRLPGTSVKIRGCFWSHLACFDLVFKKISIYTNHRLQDMEPTGSRGRDKSHDKS
jgi:hypothetical protein